jgi:hypothetical protein
LILTATVAKASGDEAPAWLLQAAKTPVPSVEKNVSSVVLVDESSMTVSEDGRMVTVSTYAIRILNREGRDEAVARVSYATDTGKVREIKAWMVRPSGQVKAYGKDYVIDEAAVANDVYDESRIKKIVAVDDAEPGAVFGYQTVDEERPFFNQTTWYFQGVDPVISSRVTLTLPSGWKATSVTFNHANVEPTVSGTSYSWELRDLPAISFEPASPAWTNLAPRLAINYFPGEGTASPAARSFDTWTDVSSWYTKLTDAQSQPDEALTAKARELTTNARTELEKLQAISSYVQSIQYISVQIGEGRWRPHAASQVFAKSYGDCKDKANLMRAMLKVLNIESYPVLIFSGDNTYVRETWPSPRQFNHCIIAVKVSDAVQGPMVITHPKIGRLLIFDATDDDTPIGDLPEHEQNSLALIAAGDSGSLTRMPATPAEANSLERQIDATVDMEGALTATISEKSKGSLAARYRSEYRHEAQSGYLKMIEAWLTRGATGARVSKISPRDDRLGGRFDLGVDFSAPAYGQLMQNRLLVFKPAIVSRREALALTDAKRTHPVVLRSAAYSETVRVRIPEGFNVDEMPDAVKLDTSFGSYVTTYEVKDGQLIFTRKLVQQAAMIPAEQYSSVRTFFEKIRSAEQSPVVLARK